MNLFKTKLGRKFLFACLYLSEGAPIGFIWLALPTRMRASGVPIEQITWLSAILVLPWTFKFAWAPLIDFFRCSRWTLRHWIILAQSIMGLTLVPLLWMDPKQQFTALAGLLLVHGLAAATQDVAIDALCISSTDAGERGEYNGWMQTGMLLGRAIMGGGALVLASYLGESTVVGLLIFLTSFSLFLVILSRPPSLAAEGWEHAQRLRSLGHAVKDALTDRSTWFGLAFAVLGGAAFKSLEVIYGPFLIDRGIESGAIGWFSLGPMIGAMIVGALLGGRLTDRLGARRCTAASLLFMAISITGLALADYVSAGTSRWVLLGCLAITAFGIGIFTASSYAMLMDISRPAIAATQFSAFMGATNACESWSTFTSGRIISSYGYPTAMLVMSMASIVALPLLWGITPRSELSRSLP